MPIPPVPTLTSAGILTEPNQIADYLFKCFLATEQSQSTYYAVYSLPYLVEQNTGKINNLPDDVANALKALYASYFESVTANVYLKDMVEQPEKVALIIKMTLTNDGKIYDLSRLVEKTEDNFYIDSPI